MKAILLSFFFFALCVSPLKANPCGEDVDKYCGNVQPGAGAVGSCMESNMDKLSHACREHIKKMDSSLKQLQNACSWAARDYCRDVRPGYGRLKNCLMNHFDKVPTDCQEALKAN